MRKGGQSAEVALTAENIPMKCAEEVASVVQKMESTQKVGGGAKAVQEDIAQKIRNVGDDILDTMEKAGGHTLERHVAKTSTDLAKRMSKRSLVTSASSFTNKRTAIKAVKESLKHNAERIASWLNDPLIDKIIIEFSHTHPIGSVVPKVKKNPLYNLTNSRMVLKKDLTSGFGFKIVTAFPIIWSDILEKI